ncbi:MAG: RNA polymerase sigma factor [Ruminococcus sp.]|nr:RNA polymerase sigma factor [Ruminococcus sp.]
MDDNKIISLFESRNQLAIGAVSEKYGDYCMKISMNILSNVSDSEENVNDTYMQVWNSIPPQRPESLTAYIARIARNLAINKMRRKSALKRGASEASISLSELDDCTPSGVSVENEAEVKMLSRHISDFLHTQKEDARKVFVRRYFYCDSIEDIAESFGFSISKVKSILMRTRNKLGTYLQKEGYSI